MTFQRRPDRRVGGPRSDDRRPRNGGPRGGRRERPIDDIPDAGRRQAGPPPRRGGPPPRNWEPDEPGMTLRLDPPRLRELQRMARDAGLRPNQLAQRWVEERLARGRPDSPETPASPPPAVRPGELDELAARLAEQSARLAELAAQVAQLGAAGQARSEAAHTDDGSTRRRPRLHEEIMAVLREGSGPMSAGEIAQAIRDRGQYRAPRSNEQVNGAMVSGRVSNPHYRSLFVRQGRRIGLAEQASQG